MLPTEAHRLGDASMASSMGFIKWDADKQSPSPSELSLQQAILITKAQKKTLLHNFAPLRYGTADTQFLICHHVMSWYDQGQWILPYHRLRIFHFFYSIEKSLFTSIAHIQTVDRASLHTIWGTLSGHKMGLYLMFPNACLIAPVQIMVFKISPHLIKLLRYETRRMIGSQFIKILPGIFCWPWQQVGQRWGWRPDGSQDVAWCTSHLKV